MLAGERELQTRMIADLDFNSAGAYVGVGGGM